MKLLKFLLILILLIFPLGELFRFDIGNNIVIKPIDIFVGFALLITSILFVLKKIKFPNTYLTKPLVIFSVVALLSLIINFDNLFFNQVLTAFLYWVRFVAYTSVFYIIVTIDKHSIWITKKLLLVSGALFIFLGFIQYFIYANLRNLYYLGWDEHNYRLFSTFLDPNFAGAFLVLFLVFLFSKIKNNFDENNTNNPVKFGVLAVLNVVAIFLTYSRSALLMFIVAVSVYLFLIGKKKFLLIPVIFTLVILSFISPTFNKENTNIFRTASSFARFETYDNALQIIYDQPFLGVGFNAYRYAQERYGFRPVDSKYPDHAEAGTDNSFLFVAATTGTIGLGAYIFLLFSILNKAFLLRRKGNRLFPSVVIASFVGIFINSFFINSLFFPPIMLWMWVMVGLMDREE